MLKGSRIIEQFDVQQNDELLGNNFNKINFHKNYLYGDLEIEYQPIEIEIVANKEALINVRYDAVEPQYPEYKTIAFDYMYNTYVDKDVLIDYIFDVYDLNSDEVTVKEFQKYVDELNKEPDDYFKYLQKLYKEDAQEDAYEYYHNNFYDDEEY